jgi:hypothetical protein
MAEVPSLDLLGEYARSQSGRYLLVWSDSDPSGGRSGSRKSGHGRYVLFEGDHLIAQGSLERPNDGHVANTGTFILSDWLFGDGLDGTFYVFDTSGTIRIQHHFSANLFSSGIAEDGAYAACQLANSDTDDGGTLALFDIAQQQMLWQKCAETGWPQSYAFDSTSQRIGLGYGELGVFWYSIGGQFLDQARWADAQLRSGSGYAVLQIVRDRYHASPQPLSPDHAAALLEMTRTAAERLSRWPKDQAKAERLAGEIAEASGNVSEAIRYYETALALDPRCGIKQHLKSLR